MKKDYIHQKKKKKSHSYSPMMLLLLQTVNKIDWGLSFSDT